MLLLLNIQDGAILECPLHDVRFRRGPLDEVGFVELGPEFVEVLQLDEVPNLGERGGDDGGFGDGGGCGDAGRHYGGFFLDFGWIRLEALGG